MLEKIKAKRDAMNAEIAEHETAIVEHQKAIDSLTEKRDLYNEVIREAEEDLTESCETTNCEVAEEKAEADDSDVVEAISYCAGV